MQRRGPDVDELLDALALIIADLEYDAEAAHAGLARHSFAPYRAYRARANAYEALVSVIEDKLANLPPGKVERIKHQMTRIHGRMLAVTIHGALKFFRALSAVPHLPLGLYEIFCQEQRALAEAREALRDPVHAAGMPETLAHDLEVAEIALKEILRRAQPLRDFGERRALHQS